MSKIILPEGWPRPSGFSNAVVANGRWLAIAGQIGWDPVTSALAGEDIVSQTEQALRNIVTVLHAAGGKPKHLVRLTWYVTKKKAYSSARERIGELYAEIIGKHYPAMTLVAVAGLLEPGACVEIEATAILP
jgi:enamine deaminase RidA (YjgF/YER057c/UK114 family)